MAKQKKNELREVEQPLDESHLAILNRLLESIPKTREFLEACHDCQLDVALEMKENADQEKIASKIKAKFFPTVT